MGDAKKKPHQTLYNGLLSILTSDAFVHSLATLLDALSEVGILSESLQRDNISIGAAYVTMRQTIRALQNQKDGTAGEHFAEFNGSAVSFKGVALTYSETKPRLNKPQFLQALIDCMQSRLHCTVASNRSATSTSGNAELKSVIEDIDILNPMRWPSHVESPWPEGELRLKSLCNRLQVSFSDYRKPFRDFISLPDTVPHEIMDLQEAVACYPVASADCERGFSAMNLICSDIRSTLTIKNISNLLFISLVGPPLAMFNPKPYVKEWLKRHHRHAEDPRSRRLTSKESSRYASIWPLFA